MHKNDCTAGSVKFWPWPWSPKEETTVWGLFILRGLGKINDLDRRLHLHLSMTSKPSQFTNVLRFGFPDNGAYQLAMRRRMGMRNPGDPEDYPELVYSWGPTDVTLAQFKKASGGDDEEGMYGFSDEDVQELLSQGVKPWDDDAGMVLAALHGDV